MYVVHAYIPDTTSAGGSFPPSRAGGFLRRERPVVEERRRARAACDLEGNRAGLGCLERLGNALSFAVVTEWQRAGHHRKERPWAGFRGPGAPRPRP